MIPEVNLAYVFSFQIKYKFYYFCYRSQSRKPSQQQCRPTNRLRLVRERRTQRQRCPNWLVFVCSRQTVLINQPLKSRSFLYYFTRQTLILVVQSVVFSVHQLRGQDGASRSLPAMPEAGEMQNLSPSSGSALLSRKGHMSRVSSQDDEDTGSACRGRGRERNVDSYVVWRHVLRPIHRGQRHIHSLDRRHLPPTIWVCVTVFTHLQQIIMRLHTKMFLYVNFCLVITSK